MLFRRDFLSGSVSHRESGEVSVSSLPSTLQFDEESSGQVQRAVDAIEKEYRSRDTYASSLIRAQMQSLILLAARRAEAVGSREDPGSIGARFTRLLDESFRREHSPAFYADHLGVTVGHLNVVLRESLGETTTNLIRDRLMLEARRILVHTAHSIGEVAWHLGFEDPSYFTRAFRRCVGMSPAKFRAAYTEDIRTDRGA
jgi:AraC-like DNA-binding protein